MFTDCSSCSGYVRELHESSDLPLPSDIQARSMASCHSGSVRRASKTADDPSNSRTLTAISLCHEVEHRWIPAKIALKVNVMSGGHCEVAQMTNRLTWSSVLGLEQKISSHKLAQAQDLRYTTRSNPPVVYSATVLSSTGSGVVSVRSSRSPLDTFSAATLRSSSVCNAVLPPANIAPLHTPPPTCAGWRSGHECRRKHASQALEQRLFCSKHVEGLSPAKLSRSLRRRPQSSQSKEYGQSSSRALAYLTSGFRHVACAMQVLSIRHLSSRRGLSVLSRHGPHDAECALQILCQGTWAIVACVCTCMPLTRYTRAAVDSVKDAPSHIFFLMVESSTGLLAAASLSTTAVVALNPTLPLHHHCSPCKPMIWHRSNNSSSRKRWDTQSKKMCQTSQTPRRTYRLHSPSR